MKGISYELAQEGMLWISLEFQLKMEGNYAGAAQIESESFLLTFQLKMKRNSFGLAQDGISLISAEFL